MGRFADQLGAAIADTELEVFKHAFLETAPDDNDDGNQLVEQLSQVTGWEEPVSDQEGMIRAIQGDDADPNYIGDKPGEYQHELEVERENAALRAQIQQKDAEMAAWHQRYNPDVQIQAETDRMAFLEQNGLMSLDDTKATPFLGQIAAIERQRNELFNERGRQSLERAREKYGEAFDEVAANFDRLDLRNNSMARALAAHIQGAADPGEAVVAAADTIASLADARNGWQPPFARSREPDYRPSRWPAHGNAVEDSGYDANTDNEIFWDAMRR